MAYGFTNYLEEKFGILPPSTFSIHKWWKTEIPEIPPNFPTLASHLTDESDSLRRHDPTNLRIQILSKNIKTMVPEHVRNKWRSHLAASRNSKAFGTDGSPNFPAEPKPNHPEHMEDR